ncbi:MAG TPA: DUF2269 domain-containing protein [Turneriella sp.]|nr:DUF2269 domain-containing protein [Turneriella sp.]HNA79458.1 DUF2269 domain-containing protein [Turneriella sp.]HNE18954.1 DUF2269 domain-containing protein [Turneriella sp.]HNJ65649.1 DUF2269 domain-containing protein [Turneriella sp.]HNL09793.1 DUF2269 domain-containing protein [Turneriella sp.]
MTYAILKLIHILSATILFGGGICAALIGTLIFGSKNVKLIGAAGAYVLKVEFYLTVVSFAIQVGTGFWMAGIAGFSIFSGWIGMALVLLVIAAICWIPGLWLQHKMAALANEASNSDMALPTKYDTYFRIWTALGLPSTVAMVGIFYLMVLKA